MRLLLLCIALPIFGGNTPDYFKKMDIKIKKHHLYVSRLRRRSDSCIIRKQPKRNIRKKQAAKQLRWL